MGKKSPAGALSGDKKPLDSLQGRSRASLVVGFIAQVRVAGEIGKPQFDGHTDKPFRRGLGNPGLDLENFTIDLR